ncbi:capsid assembly scaffolding protein Gp46 family protein [Thermomonospora cellulosilytica]|uniref:Scaffolding protein n=1 Tax=Thermomonospora cellulosilytica TaxID=1411118 RepID=A0A7W3MUE9_9ACTN|nr:DUF4355 domain-containing protein [Thermomonospora cellulosilytica]MBA9002017.1 hypothetical protein [Thermomonospora cellulosilytica]
MSDDTTTTPAAPAEKTFTQAELDRIVAERLRREREKYADYDDLKARAQAADASKSELQKLAERVEAAEKRAADMEAKALRAEVAQAKGLTPAQAKRLTGTTREELEADADELLEVFGGRKDSGGKDGGTDTGADKDDPEPDSGKGEGDAGAALFGRPKEVLVSGAAPDREPGKSADELADEVLKKARGGL